MRSRVLASALFLVVVSTAATLANSATKQWTIVNFRDPVQVKDAIVMGPVLIVHDDVKMANGEPCTTFYRFDPARGPREELVSFHCRPVRRDLTAFSTFTVERRAPECKRLVEYQIAGDSEGHGIPGK